MKQVFIIMVALLILFCGGQKQPAPIKSETQADANEETKKDLPKLWDFFATWCPPCKMQAPIIEELAAEYSGQIEIISIDTDKNPDLARKFNIQAIPTLIFLDPSGKELSRRVGFFPKDSILARFKLHGFIK
ncbi:MAG: thioredoxin domain-containing protein [candidate division WOR-3 bacterium]